MPTQITNFGTMGILFNFAPNFGVQSGLSLTGPVSGPVSGVLFNTSANFGSQAGITLHW
jgi:hypothetical protein